MNEKLCEKHSFLKNTTPVYNGCYYCFLEEDSEIFSFTVKRKEGEDTQQFLSRAVNLKHNPFRVCGIEWSEKHEKINRDNAVDIGAYTDFCQVHSRINVSLDDDTIICFPHYFI